VAVLADVAGVSADSSSSSAAAPVRPLQADSAVLCVLHQAFSAVAAAAAATPQAASEGFDSVAALVTDVVTMLAQLQQLVTAVLQRRQQQGSPVGALQAHCEDVVQVRQLQLWLPLLLQDVLSLPAAAAPLSQAHLDLIARQLVQLALHGSSGDSELELQPGLELSEHGAAASALAKLASWPPAEVSAASAPARPGMQALSSHATSVLLPLLQNSTGDGNSEALALRQRASSLMQQLAGSSPAAAWQVLLWLQPVVLQQTQQGAWVSP
jgi:hypothetical protein